ncbi:carbon storage regulator CsrA [Metabacillus fastidiosus]|uniref:carbon storage regulator CsrA n=1 Tax=Metabacillus fastidiosus TaxID=1458 RepID=UPI003D2969C6
MLVLSRKLNESIMVEKDIEITILEVDGDQVKIGINAPRNIEIHRSEVFNKIAEENRKAMQGSIDLLSQLNKSI